MKLHPAPVVGEKRGKLTVMSVLERVRGVRLSVICKCECGRVKEYVWKNVAQGTSTSCGYCISRYIPPTRTFDLAGRRFGRLTVLREGERRGTSRCAVCRCDCGKETLVRFSRLVDGGTVSCGCLAGEQTRARSLKHGAAVGGKLTPEYRAWTSMLVRCDPERRDKYKYRRYAGRGIAVIERWRGEHGFENFLADMGPRPGPGYSIDRYPNNDGNYEPSNCRWATMREQQANRSSNHPLTIGGVTKPMCEWSRQYGLPKWILQHRIAAGWRPDQAVGIPVASSRSEAMKLSWQMRRA